MRALAALVLAAGAACGSSSSSPPGGEAPGFRLEDVLTGIPQATDVAFLPDGRLLVTTRDGGVFVGAPGGPPREIGRFEVDVSNPEKGLLGVVVDPAFAGTRRAFLYYSRADSAGGTDVDRHRVVSVRLGAGDVIEDEVVLVDGLRGPANHDGGALEIGPDGRLYVGVGDSGCNSGSAPEPPYTPTNWFGTCLTNANGKILRVELDGGIPADNPLASIAAVTACGAACGDPISAATGPPRREVWAWGFRNPWRFAFDPVTGLLWVGDVGEITWEELTIVEAGAHHGWPFREGAHGWPRSRCREVIPAGDCVDPVYECGRGEGPDGDCAAITAGAFLTGPRWPEPLRDHYLFGDSATGRLWTLRLTADRRGVVPGSRRELARLAAPVSIRAAPGGDVHVVLLGGTVVRISPP